MNTTALQRLLGTLTIAGGLAVSGAALAVPTLKLSDSAGNSVTITDNNLLAPAVAGPGVSFDGLVGDDSTAAGVVQFDGSIGSFVVQLSVGTTKPVVGSAASPQMDLFNLSISGGSGNLTVEFSETDFVGGPPVDVLNTAIGGTTQGSVDFAAYVDFGNTLFGQGTQIASFSPVPNVGGTSIAGSASQLVNLTGPFSLTHVATISHNGPATTSFDAFTSVPEPATVILLGAGLLGIGAASRRRRRAQA